MIGPVGQASPLWFTRAQCMCAAGVPCRCGSVSPVSVVGVRGVAWGVVSDAARSVCPRVAVERGSVGDAAGGGPRMRLPIECCPGCAFFHGRVARGASLCQLMARPSLRGRARG